MQGSYTALSSVYDKLMYDVDYDSWADYIISLLPEGCRKIGETACGTGSITLRLAAKGYKLTASDISQDMLNTAAANARANGLKPTFIRQDMTQLDLPLQHAVICCCDGVNYLTKDEQLLSFFKRAYACLKEGGRLLFDISSSYKLRNILSGNLFFDDSDDITYFWQNSRMQEDNLINMTLTIFKRSGELYSREDEAHTQRAYSTDEILLFLKKAGFGEAHAYSFLTTNPSTNKDERIQFIAQK